MLNQNNKITLGGKDFVAAALTLEDLGELQDFVNSRIPDPIEVARDLAQGMPDEVAKSILTTAYDDVRSGARKLGSPEATAVLQTLEGMAFLIWLHCRKAHPDIVVGEWLKMFIDDVESEVKKAELSALSEEKGGALPSKKKSIYHTHERPTVWERVFSYLIQKYSWTPAQIRKLTVPEVSLLMDIYRSEQAQA